MQDSNRPPERGIKEPSCFNCGETGHWAIACHEPTRAVPAYAVSLPSHKVSRLTSISVAFRIKMVDKIAAPRGAPIRTGDPVRLVRIAKPPMPMAMVG